MIWTICFLLHHRDFEETTYWSSVSNRSTSISSSGSINTFESFNNSPEMPRYSPIQNWQFEHIVDDYSVSYSLLDNLSPVYNNEQQSPFLHINNHPVSIFRYRYETEMKTQSPEKRQINTHGLLDIQDENKQKSPPSISLRNFQGTAKIVCDLYQVIDGEMSKLHPHLLCRKEENRMEHEIFGIAEENNNWTVQFPGLFIMHTKRKDISKILIRKENARRRYEGHNQLDPLQIQLIQNRTKINEIELNRVALGFEAYESILNGNNQIWRKIAGPILSKPILNSDSVTTGKWKICGISLKTGLMCGGEVMYMFVEKVSKSNFKLNLHSERTSCSSQLNCIKVHIILYRPSDGATSDPIEFIYRSALSDIRAADALVSNASSYHARNYEYLVTDAVRPSIATRTKNEETKRLKLKVPKVPDSKRYYEDFLDFCSGQLIDESNSESEKTDVDDCTEDESESISNSDDDLSTTIEAREICFP